MNLVQNTFPDTLPVLFSEMKTQLRIDGNDEDVIVVAKTRAAQSIVEKFTNRILLSSTFSLYLDAVPECGTVYIMKFPVTSIDSVKYINSAGTLTTLTLGTDYVIDIKDCPTRVVFITTPSIQSNVLNGLEINFTAGHSDINDIDQGIVEALKLIAGSFQEVRQNDGSYSVNETSINYKVILNLYVKGSYLG